MYAGTLRHQSLQACHCVLCNVQNCTLPKHAFDSMCHYHHKYNENNTERAHGSFQNPPDPTYGPLPDLMVGVCLVLAPDVNLLHNSRKQGYPCYCGLFFLHLLVLILSIIPLTYTCAHKLARNDACAHTHNSPRPQAHTSCSTQAPHTCTNTNLVCTRVSTHTLTYLTEHAAGACAVWC